MQSTSVFNRSLAYAHEQALSKRKRYDRTSSIYKTRKWRSNRPILTTDQIQELGKLIGEKTLQKSMDLFMNPANLLQMNKPKLNTIYQFLLDRGLEKGRIATTKLKQYPFAVRLFDILYPGFPIWRANEQALKLQRESVSEKRKARPGLAYDQLPTSDIFERLEELVRVDVHQHYTQYSYDEEQGEEEEEEEEGHVQKQIITIPTEGLLNFAQERTSSKKKDTRDIRLHLYLWTSIRLCWEPRVSEFNVDTKCNQWTQVDQKNVEKHGYKHIDITEKVDWQDVLKNRAESGGEILIEFDCDVDIKQASICTVWQKAPIELAGHLYIQTAGTYICRLVENAKSRSEIASIQEKSFNLLGKKDDRRTNIYCARSLFNDCMGTIKAEENNKNVNGSRNDTMEDDEIDILMGDQVISLLDPILFTHIEFPCRGVYCKHASCFDAACFFQCHGVDRTWQCPLCAVQYKSIQDLYIDRDLDQAITRYPEESKLILRDGELFPSSEEPELHKKIKVEHIS